MQLEKVVQYHKALADPMRIRILILLAERELSGQELAERLHVTPATITHHTAKLRTASLLTERRDKNTIFFSLNRYFIENSAQASLRLILRTAEGGAAMLDDAQMKWKQSVLNNFYAEDGKLKNIPAQLKKKLVVLEALAEKLEPGRKYAEKEINEFIRTVHDDFATIRREFIMHQFMYRENDIYELNPREMWTRWEKLR